MLFPISKIGVKSLFGAQLSAESVLLSIPGGFAMTDPIKLYILKRRFHVPPIEVLGSLITRHWLLGITQLIFICTACILGFFVTEQQLLTSYVQNGTLFIAISVLILVSFSLGIIVRNLMRGTLACRAWELLHGINIQSFKDRLKRALPSFKKADECFAALGKRNAWSILYPALFYLFLWTMDVWETMLVAQSSGFHITFIHAILIEAVLSVVRLGVFFLPGGIVVKDLGYFALFTSFHIRAFAVQIAAFVLVKRLVSIFCITIGYLVLLGQGVGSIWKRTSLSYKTIKESL